jgi:hypothetical protein
MANESGWNIGGDLNPMNILKLGATVFLSSEALKAQKETARTQGETQNQTMKIITVAVIILITMYAIKRA